MIYIRSPQQDFFWSIHQNVDWQSRDSVGQTSDFRCFLAAQVLFSSDYLPMALQLNQTRCYEHVRIKIGEEQ
jgi:hypothetical protein